MSTTRDATVLFADVSGSTALYEKAGDAAAARAIEGCLGAMRLAVEANRGRVVKTIGDEVMALFPSPDAAAAAAVRMHLGVEALPAVGGSALGVRIAFHAGPVVQREDDVFGDTVNLASRLAGQAIKGQVLTSEATAAMLSPLLRSSTRRLYPIQVKGKADEVALYEFVWRRSPDVTDVAGRLSVPRAPALVLRLRYRGREVMGRRLNESLVIGRDPGCDLVIADIKASRQHCSIERRDGQFVLRDHSANGTYLTVAGEPELALQRQGCALRGHGWIALGLPRSPARDAVEYFCEAVEDPPDLPP